MKRRPAGIYLFKVNNRNTRERCEIGSKLKIKTLVSLCFEHNILVFAFLTLNK